MVDFENMAQEFYQVDEVVTHLLKIWSNKDQENLELIDILTLPDYYDLVKSSTVVYDLVEQGILEVVFGLRSSRKVKATDWFIGLSNNFRLSVKEVDTKTKVAILNAIEILSKNPRVNGVCMPMPQGLAGQWCYQDKSMKLVYELDEKNKRLSVRNLIQGNTEEGEALFIYDI